QRSACIQGAHPAQADERDLRAVSRGGPLGCAYLPPHPAWPQPPHHPPLLHAHGQGLGRPFISVSFPFTRTGCACAVPPGSPPGRALSRRPPASCCTCAWLLRRRGRADLDPAPPRPVDRSSCQPPSRLRRSAVSNHARSSSARSVLAAVPGCAPPRR